MGSNRVEPQEDLPLPAIAAKADDLKAIRKAVKDAAGVSIGLGSHISSCSFMLRLLPAR
jgi:hypothetical protein